MLLLEPPRFGFITQPTKRCLFLRFIGEAIAIGGDPNTLEPFPEKPPHMHWRTYERLRRVYEIARDRSIQGVLGRVPRVERDLR